MPSHMSSIGFPVTTEDEFADFAQLGAQQGEAIDLPGVGTYFRWQAGEGAELWVQIALDDSIVGMNPHFSGKARMRVGIVDRFGTEDNALEGTFVGWANPVDEGPASGSYPFAFDSPDFALHLDGKLPLIREVQIAAFAHQLTAFADEAAYLDAQRATPKFAAESFIPSGLLRPGEAPSQPPEAVATFSGRVLEAARLLNPITGEAFHWALVRTLGGNVDVIADPEVLGGKMKPGGVIRGSFWLSGRIIG